MYRLAVLTAVLIALLVAPAGAAERKVPQGWLGVTVDGPVTADEPGEWDRMAAAGVETVRVEFRWYESQPYPPGGVPVAERSRFVDMDGVPTDLSSFDAIVGTAAARRIAVLPVVHRTPAWAALQPGHFGSPPADPAMLGHFCSVLVKRYGPKGSFWRERPHLPRVPIRAWQVWNEPNLEGFWSEQPFAPSYVGSLRAAASAIHTTDPGAQVVLAGVPNRSWSALRSIYDAGGRGSFDAVALHPYTRRPRDVLRLIIRTRRVLRAHGDADLPVWVTELSWPASKGKADSDVGFEVTEAAQPKRLRSALRLLSAARERLKIQRVFWYTWLSTEQGSGAFHWSGLRRMRRGKVVSTGALTAFRRVARRLQGCRKARRDAMRCA